jgi:hypothetical protein
MEGELKIPMGQSGQNLGYMKAGDDSQDMLQAELQAFASAIVQNHPPPISGREGRDALAVALSVIEKSDKASEAFRTDG